MTMHQRWGYHLFDLLVRISVGARGELVKPVPQRRDHTVNHLAGGIEQPQRIGLGLVGQTERIA